MCLLAKQITEASKTKLCDEINKIPVYCFPKNKEERQQWIKSVPNANLNVTNNTVICQQYWPSNFDTIEVHGKIRPKNPLLVWPGVPSSQIPTLSAVQRNIKKTSSPVRNQIADGLSAFLELDKINYTNFKESLLNDQKDFVCPVVAFLDENILTVQSSKFVDSIPLFMFRIYNSLCFETFHYGVKRYISSLSKNHINTVDTWLKQEEIIRNLNSMAFSCVNFWNKTWWFLSLRVLDYCLHLYCYFHNVLADMSSGLLQVFGELGNLHGTLNYVLYWIHGGCLFWFH